MPDTTEPKTIDLMKVLTDSLARREDAAGERLAQIAARLNAATPGPWEHCHEIKSLGYIAILGQSQDNQQHYVRSTGGGVVDDGARHDAEFIAHSRSDMEYLLAALSTTEREREALHQQLGSAIDVARETMTEITVGRIASIGSIGNTYCPQIRVSRIEQLHERLVALADSYRARVPSGGEEGR